MSTTAEATSQGRNASPVEGALPYTLEFVPLPDDAERPALQAYSFMVSPDGSWYIIGGRAHQGLHTFNTRGLNFPADERNHFLWKIDPGTGQAQKVVDLRLLDPGIGDPLMSTNQQYYYDRRSNEWLIMGGFGWDSQVEGMRTFDTLIRIPITQVVGYAENPSWPASAIAQAINEVIHCQHDPFFAVTGGSLRRLGGRYLIVFGQGFQGRYDPFEGIVAQQYTNAVRYFRLDPTTGQAMGMGAITSADLDQPYHRRDLPVVDSVDPATGRQRVAAFGGVFPPGKLGGYLNPVYVQETAGALRAWTDRSVEQLFNQYECPTVVVWDPPSRTVFHTFFGGISHYYYHQTEAQKAVYEEVTAEGRNDGLPWISDITTLLERGDGTYQEYISPNPVPGNKLRGGSVELIPATTPGGSLVSETGVVDLSQLSDGQRALIGHVYGGIEAEFPLPKIPNFGTQATNALYQVFIIKTPSAQIPAAAGHEARGVLPEPSGAP